MSDMGVGIINYLTQFFLLFWKENGIFKCRGGLQNTLVLNSDRIGREKCVQLIKEYVKIRFEE